MTATFGHGSFHGFADERDVEEADEDLSPEETISNNIQKFSHNVLQMRQLVDNIGTTLDSIALRQRVSQLQTETNAITKTTNGSIKEYATAGPPNGNQKEWKVKQTLLRENFHDVLQDYNDLQKTAQRKLRATLRMSLRQSAITGPRKNEAPENEELERDSLLDQISDIQAEVDLEIVKEREQAIMQLESDIVDINGIFKDLATMIHDQGEDIGPIDASTCAQNLAHILLAVVIDETIDVVVTDVSIGKDELDIAEKNVTKARRRKLYCILLVCLIVVMATVVVVVIVVSKSASPSSTAAPIKADTDYTSTTAGT